MSARQQGTLVSDAFTDVWDFGGFPYGLEPLVIPPAGQARATSCPVTAWTQDTGTGRERWNTPVDDDLAGLGRPRPADPERLFWFRWITGHQVTFLMWHLMGRLLRAVPAQSEPEPVVLTRLAAYTHGYNAMLLYTGSCPRDLYDSLIRPRMFLQHQGFSGTWAPDFAQVRRLFRGRGPTWYRATTGEAGALRVAVATNRLIHEGIAARLVPDGQSLLQQTLQTTVVRPSEHTALIYDNFFLTLRAAVPHEYVVGQLLHRLRAVALDLAANGLLPLPPDPADEPEQLRGDTVARCAMGIRDTIRVVGDQAAADDRE